VARELRGKSAPADVAVRMDMGADVAEVIAQLLPRLPEDVLERVLDQLWLRAVFVEQRRRTQIAERSTFDARADRILIALDPSDERRGGATS
jgi:hypothetical protein